MFRRSTFPDATGEIELGKAVGVMRFFMIAMAAVSGVVIEGMAVRSKEDCSTFVGTVSAGSASLLPCDLVGFVAVLAVGVIALSTIASFLLMARKPGSSVAVFIIGTIGALTAAISAFSRVRA